MKNTSLLLASMSTTLNVTWQGTAGLKQWGMAVGVSREIAIETGKCVCVCVCVRGAAGKSSEARMWVDAD